MSVRNRSLDLNRKDMLDILSSLSEAKEIFKDINPGHTPAVKVSAKLFKELISTIAVVGKIPGMELTNNTGDFYLKVLNMPVVVYGAVPDLKEELAIISYEEHIGKAEGLTQ